MPRNSACATPRYRNLTQIRYWLPGIKRQGTPSNVNQPATGRGIKRCPRRSCLPPAGSLDPAPLRRKRCGCFAFRSSMPSPIPSFRVAKPGQSRQQQSQARAARGSHWVARGCCKRRDRSVGKENPLRKWSNRIAGCGRKTLLHSKGFKSP